LRRPHPRPSRAGPTGPALDQSLPTKGLQRLHSVSPGLFTARDRDRALSARCARRGQREPSCLPRRVFRCGRDPVAIMRGRCQQRVGADERAMARWSPLAAQRGVRRAERRGRCPRDGFAQPP
jgi:hypothetical protein